MKMKLIPGWRGNIFCCTDCHTTEGVKYDIDRYAYCGECVMKHLDPHPNVEEAETIIVFPRTNVREYNHVVEKYKQILFIHNTATNEIGEVLTECCTLMSRVELEPHIRKEIIEEIKKERGIENGKN